MSKIKKELIQLNRKKKIQQIAILKWANNLNRHFFQSNIKMANKYVIGVTSNYQENTNQNHNEISPHTRWNGYSLKDKR